MHPGIAPIIVNKPQIVVRATNTTTAAGASINLPVNLPASLVANELLIIMAAVRDAGSPTFLTPAGWTVLPNFNDGISGNIKRVGGFYKVASGGEGATVTLSGSSGASFDNEVAVSMAIQNYQGTPEGVAGATFAASANPDPPSLTPSWGAQLALKLAICAQDGNAAVNSWPSGFASLVSIASSTALSLNVGFKIDGASPENPGTFTLAAARTGWAETVAIRN